MFADRPDLAEAVTPNYPYPGKRPILNSTFYPTLLRDNVELVPHAVESVTEKGVIDVNGNEYLADVLVMATGFQPASYLSSLEIVGVGGRTIHEAWADEPRALLGMTVPGFPNFFIQYGPNTNGGEIVSLLERQAEHVVHCAKRLMRTGSTAIEVRPSFYDAYNRWIDRQMRGTAWVVSNNYYKAPTGRIVTQWPFGPLLYGLLSKTLAPLSERTRVATAIRQPVSVG